MVHIERSLGLRLLTLVVLYLWSSGMHAQCRVDTNVVIHATDTIDLSLPVSGILNDDLNAPGQGLCRVDISFEHEYVGDLLVWLRSPSGQEVQLIGGEVMSGFTNFQKWNISFVPAGIMAKPDLGFSARWSNNQTWGVGGAGGYSGSYYPFAGDLDMFNLGPVNGVWTLHIEDRSRFYAGRISGIRLFFCDDIGSECHPCSPNQMTIIHNSIEACKGDEILRFFPEVEIRGTAEDSMRYIDTLILLRDSVLLRYGDIFDLRLEEAGVYTICGLSYYPTASDKLPILGQSWPQWLRQYSSDTLGVCIGFSSNCVEVKIFESRDTTYVEDWFCAGDTYMWGDTVLRESGTYERVFATLAGGCDSVVILELHSTVLLGQIDPPDTLTCQRDSVTLHYRLTSPIREAEYLWSTDTGYIREGGTDSAVVVVLPGVYQLRVRVGQCVDSIEVEVLRDTSVPMIQLHGGVLDCDVDSLCLFPIVGGRVDSYEWSDSSTLILGRDSFLCIREPGTYNLMVRSDNGCRSTRVVEVVGDYAVRSPNVIGNALTCRADTAIWALGNPEDYRAWVWRSPAGDSLSSDTTVGLYQPGRYRIEGIGENGCVTSVHFEVEDEKDTLKAVFTRAVLTCRDTQIVLQAGLDTQAAHFEWLLPDGQITYSPTLTVTRPGHYGLHYVSSKGCVLDTFLKVAIDTLLPQIRYFTDTIRCDRPTVQLTPEGDTSGLDISWSGPGDYMFEGFSPAVGRKGEYTAMVTGANSCALDIKVRVVADTAIPDLHIQSSSIVLDCANPDSIRLEALTSHPNVVAYKWFLPTGTADTPTVMANQEGWYKVEVRTGANCFTEDSIFIKRDTLIPDFRVIPGDTITCSHPVSWWKVLTADSTARIFWRSDQGGMAFGDSIALSKGGALTMWIEGGNGCVDSIEYEIVTDTLAPELEGIDDTIRCTQTSIPLSFVGDTSQLVQVRWVTEQGDELVGVPPIIDEGGVYYLEAEGRNGCYSVDSSVIGWDTLPPSITLVEDTITCIEDRATLRALLPSGLDTFYWRGPTGVLSSDTLLSVPDSGPYSFIGIGLNGCIDSQEVEVYVDTLSPRVSAQVLDSLDCRTPQGRLLFPSRAHTIREWTCQEGDISEWLGDTVALLDSALQCSVLITDTLNGCVAEVHVNVPDNRYPPDSLRFSFHNPLCAGENNGFIEVDSVYGRYGPYTYALNQTPSLSRRWENLSEGRYVLQVSGRNGCSIDTTLSLYYPEDILADAGEDTLILLGSAAQLRGRSRVGVHDSIDSYYWLDEAGHRICDSCFNVEVLPDRDQVYTFHIETVSGCEREDEKLVRVIRSPEVFLPNTFSPNGDGVNDQWKIFMNQAGVLAVIWSIYDRWGEQIYSSHRERPQRELVLWDGTQNGVAFLPGVFVYRVRIQLDNGEQLYLDGDLTLLR